MRFLFKSLLPKKKRPQTIDEYFPKEWLGESLSISQLNDYYESIFGISIESHQSSPWAHFKNHAEWSRLISFLNTEVDIKKFDSGFCSGVAITKGEKILASVTTLNYSRQRGSYN